jgi:hypothetical protein
MCVFFGLLWIASFFETIYQCKPIAVSWDLRVLAANKGGVCHNQISTGLAFSAIFVATDVVLLALPIWVVLKLHSIERGRKIGVIFMFSLGGLTCLFCLLKLIYLHADISGPDPSCKCLPQYNRPDSKPTLQGHSSPFSFSTPLKSMLPSS